MAASARRAVQQQGAQLQGLYWLPPTRPTSSPIDLFTNPTSLETKGRLSGGLLSLPHEMILVQEKRPTAEMLRLAPFQRGFVRAFYMRHISQLVQSPNNGRRSFLVDTLALVRRLESQGMTVNQAEAITAVINDVLNDSLENAAKSCISKEEMQRREMMQEAALSKFQSEMQSTQEEKYNALQREGEKLRTDIDKLKSEIKYEIDKVTAAQRLDLNLERGHITDKLAKQSAETSNLTNKLDREINTLKTQLEASKYDVIKYCIVSVTAVGLGLVRILM
ncbi:hypothetical protein O6H91_17G013000 [Diphasiastrum complanatum]|uniref:Uncharacterized protein n=1 Tax=Diphasiastrum complanatum TaxID=34168 RepID=A0ACC2B4D3_DIPCM|nr:hypothetical protein O6H91_17G013000 [Diphasiastrum complanatum]